MIVMSAKVAGVGQNQIMKKLRSGRDQKLLPPGHMTPSKGQVIPGGGAQVKVCFL